MFIWLSSEREKGSRGEREKTKDLGVLGAMAADPAWCSYAVRNFMAASTSTGLPITSGVR